MNEKNKKRLKVSGSATLAATLLVTGSLAWRDVSQHKTNKFKTKDISQSVVLIQESNTIDNWKFGQKVANYVYVRNGQDTDSEEINYSEGFVRIQLREFLGTAESKPNVTEERYLIDIKGNYVKGESETEAREEAAKIWKDKDKLTFTVKQVKTDTDEANGAPSGGFYYVQTDHTSPNGVYGKFIQTSVDTGTEFTSIFDTSKK